MRKESSAVFFMPSSTDFNEKRLLVKTKLFINRFGRWSHPGIFDNIFGALTKAASAHIHLLPDSTRLNAHSNKPALKRALSHCIDHIKGELYSKLKAVSNGTERLIFYSAERQESASRGAVLLLDFLSESQRGVGCLGL